MMLAGTLHGAVGGDVVTRHAGRLRLLRLRSRRRGQPRDARARRQLTIPVLAVGGAVSTTGPLMGEMMREVAENASDFRVPRTRRWVTEENPDALMDGSGRFFW